MVRHIRGNPKVLATFSVALVALIAGIVVHRFSPGASGALFGATASALTGILAYLLGTVDTRDVPLPFIDAARTDVLDTGYFKREFVFEIRLDQVNSTWKLTIDFSSRVIPVISTAKMKLPLVTPPEGLRRFLSEQHNSAITYKLDGQTYDLSTGGYVQLPREQKESCVIEYTLAREITDPIDDDHRSWCPIMDETVRAKLPPNYDFVVVGLRGEADMRLSKTGGGNDGSSEFRRTEAHSSHQGFKWKLSPLQVPTS